VDLNDLDDLPCSAASKVVTGPDFEAWIDDLVEFQETVFPNHTDSELSVAMALYRQS
jgi:hypothetical protein